MLTRWLTISLKINESICPAWVASNIMPPGSVGHPGLQQLGFKHNGWGIASTLYGMFSQEDPDADYFSNSRSLNFLTIRNEMAHVSWLCCCSYLTSNILPSHTEVAKLGPLDLCTRIA